MTFCPDVHTVEQKWKKETKTKTKNQTQASLTKPSNSRRWSWKLPQGLCAGDFTQQYTAHLISFSSRRLLKCRADATPHTGGRTSQITQSSPQKRCARALRRGFMKLKSICHRVRGALSVYAADHILARKAGKQILLCFYVSSSQKSVESRKHVSEGSA